MDIYNKLQKKKVKKSNTDSKTLEKQIEVLEKLYKDGALSEEEFLKTKKFLTEKEALKILEQKKNRRILSIKELKPRIDEVKYRQIEGGWLSQIQGPPPLEWDRVESVTDKKMNDSEIELAKFGIIVISEVKSNAIILVKKTDSIVAQIGRAHI